MIKNQNLARFAVRNAKDWSDLYWAHHRPSPLVHAIKVLQGYSPPYFDISEKRRCQTQRRIDRAAGGTHMRGGA